WSLINWLAFKVKKSAQVEQIYAGFSAHRVEWEGAFINRFFQPILNSKPDSSFLELDYGKKEKDKIYPNSGKILFLEKYLPAGLFFIRLSKKQNLLLEDWHKFQSQIQRE